MDIFSSSQVQDRQNNGPTCTYTDDLSFVSFFFSSCLQCRWFFFCFFPPLFPYLSADDKKKGQGSKTTEIYTGLDNYLSSWRRRRRKKKPSTASVIESNKTPETAHSSKKKSRENQAMGSGMSATVTLLQMTAISFLTRQIVKVHPKKRSHTTAILFEC